MIQYILIALALLVVVALLWGLLKKAAVKAVIVLVNSVAGLLILLFLNTYLGWDIPITPPTIIVCGLFGVPGVCTVVILHLLGQI